MHTDDGTDARPRMHRSGPRGVAASAPGCQPSRMLYDRPVSELMSEAAAEVAGRFKAADLVDWFALRYPTVKPGTVRAHIIGSTANNPSRKHMPILSKREPPFFKTSRGWLEIFDPDVHLQDPSDDGDELVGEELDELEANSVTPLETHRPRLPSSTSRRTWRGSW